MNEILFFIAAYFSELIGTVLGFGSSTIFFPLALFFVDFKTALILVAVFHLFGNIGRISFFHKNLDKKLIFIFGIPSVILTVFGAMLVNYVNQDLLKILLGIFLLIFAIVSFIKPNLKMSSNKINSILGGSLSGFFAGLIGTGGILRGIFLTSFNLKKQVYIATAAMIALLVDITRIPIYYYSGFIEKQYYYFIPILLVIALLGSYSGKKLVDKISQKTFRKIVLIGIALLSLRLIFS